MRFRDSVCSEDAINIGFLGCQQRAAKYRFVDSWSRQSFAARETRMRRYSQCKVCGHRELAAIELAIARRVSVTALAKRYDLSTDSIYRHRRHMPATLRAS